MTKKNDTNTEANQVHISQSMKDQLQEWIITLMQRRRTVEECEEKFTPDVEKMSPYALWFYIMNMCVEMSSVFVAWMEAQRSATCSINEIFESISSKNTVSIKSIQAICREFLNAYVTAAGIVYPEVRLVWMDETDCSLLANTATAVYLERWMETDENLHENIHSFALHDLSHYKTEIKPEDDRDINQTNDYLNLWRAYANKYTRLFMLRTKQELKENTEPTVEPDITEHQRPLDIITLTWCSAWDKGYLSILDALIFQKLLLNRASKRNTQQNKAIAVKLQEYRRFLTDLEDFYSKLQIEREKNESEKKDFSTAVAYTAYCILLQKVERSSHIQLAIDMAHYALENHVEITDAEPNISAAYWARYLNSGEMLFDSINCMEDPELIQQVAEQCMNTSPIQISEISKISRKYNQINEQLNVLNYKKAITAMYHTQQEYVNEECWAEMMRRCALMDLLMLIYTVFPVDDRKSWEDQDFIDAADFFHNDYPLVGTYLKTPIPEDFTGAGKENSHCFYDHFFEFYKNLCRMDDSPLRDAVTFLTKKKQKQK